MIVDNDQLIKPTVRRLNFIVSETSYQELQDLAQTSRRSMTDLVRYGIGMIRLILEAQRHKQKLMVVDENNNAVKEIVLPSL